MDSEWIEYLVAAGAMGIVDILLEGTSRNEEVSEVMQNLKSKLQENCKVRKHFKR